MKLLKILKLPPRIKVLEALGALADGRINILSDRKAIVKSSDGTRSYNVYIDLQNNEVFSDDNGTKFRGYIGYPIIAFLIAKGILPYDEKLAKALSGIPWRELNERYKNYAVVEEIVKSIVRKHGIEESYVDNYISLVLRKLSERKFFLSSQI